MRKLHYPRSAGAITLYSLLAGLVPLVIGVVVTTWAVDESLKHRSQFVGKEIVERLDVIFESSSETLERLFPLLGQSCSMMLPALRVELDRNPYIKAAQLSWQGKPYCHSTKGSLPTRPRHLPVPTEDASPTALTFMPPDPNLNRFAVGHTLIEKSKGDYLQSLTINNLVLVDFMDLLSGSTLSAIKLGETYLWDDGSILRGEMRDTFTYQTTVESTRFGYSIYTTVSSEDVLAAFKSRLLGIFGTLAVVSILVGGLCHWVLTRGLRRSERHQAANAQRACG